MLPGALSPVIAVLVLLFASPALAARCGQAYKSDSLIEWECRAIKKGETLESLFGEAWQDVARLNRIDRRHAWPGRRIKVPKDIASIKGFTVMPAGYPPAAPYPKYILIDLSEQFLGAYEYGRLVFSAPVASGQHDNPTPSGEFTISAFKRLHRSSKYFIEKTSTPYPMNHALRFFIDRNGVSYWLHGRDMPGRAASHGCIGLFDEEMQKKHYGYPKDPQMNDAKALYGWALGEAGYATNTGEIQEPIRVKITGKAP